MSMVSLLKTSVLGNAVLIKSSCYDPEARDFSLEFTTEIQRNEVERFK